MVWLVGAHERNCVSSWFGDVNVVPLGGKNVAFAVLPQWSGSPNGQVTLKEVNGDFIYKYQGYYPHVHYPISRVTC